MNRKHFKCWLWKILWGLSALAFLTACYVARKNMMLWGFGAEKYLWDALILGVLAIPIKLDCHDCSICMK